MNLVPQGCLCILGTKYVSGRSFSTVFILNSDFFEYSTFSSITSLFLTFDLVCQFCFRLLQYILLLNLSLRRITNNGNVICCFVNWNQDESSLDLLRYFNTSTHCNIGLVFFGFTFCFKLLILFSTCNISFFQGVRSFSCILLLEDDSLQLQSSIPLAISYLDLFQLIVLASRKSSPIMVSGFSDVPFQ